MGIKMFKLDTHNHTSEISSCSVITAKDMVLAYKATGYDGIVITDHYYKEYFEQMLQKNWEEKIQQYLIGYHNALDIGKEIGLTVLLGLELRLVGSCNEYLIYGIDEDFLIHNPMLYNYSIKEIRKIANDNDLLVIQAHPFRVGMVAMGVDVLDGVEVYNGNPNHNSYNNIAFEYAIKNNLIKTSGSDCHFIEGVGNGGIILSNGVYTSRELATCLKKEKVELIQTILI